MQFIAAARLIAMSVGGTLAARGLLQSKDDIFFLRLGEITAATSGSAGDWKGLVNRRRKEWARHAAQDVPDTVIGDDERLVDEISSAAGSLRGLPISAGYAEGPACLVRAPDDLKKVKRGDILVTSVIDPGIAPLMGLAAGLIVEMGGTLSHGAIIAREYGLPAIANVLGVTHLLKDGERLALDATMGMINLAQNSTVRIVSVVAVLFLPPTLIASIYGMNFRIMPELTWVQGYPMALGMMVAAAAVTYIVFKWKHWL